MLSDAMNAAVLKGARSPYFWQFSLILLITSSKCLYLLAEEESFICKLILNNGELAFFKFTKTQSMLISPVLSINVLSWLFCVLFEFFYSF